MLNRPRPPREPYTGHFPKTHGWSSLNSKTAPSVPKNMGRKGLYKTVVDWCQRVFVQAVHGEPPVFWGANGNLMHHQIESAWPLSLRPDCGTGYNWIFVN